LEPLIPTNRSNHLLDTNAVIDLLAKNTAMVKLSNELENVSVPVFVIAELFFGAEKSARIAANKAEVESFLIDRKVIGCKVETARWYGKVAITLRVKGRPIPINDMWIAALALQYNAILVTRDAHFAQVDDLKTYSW